LIPRASITAWRGVAPWALDEHVEQDLVLSRALVDLYSNPVFREGAAFRGGTALHKLHLRPPLRYSEDLDFVQIRAGAIGPLMDAVHASLDPWLGRPRWKHGEGRTTFFYRFESTAGPAAPRKLKVEINTREHFSLYPLEPVRFSVENRWFGGSAEIVSYALEELLGTKLRALYQRKKGRDLFDLWAASVHLAPGPDGIVGTCLRYLEHGGLRVSRAEFEANVVAKVEDAAFFEDIDPLLAPGTEWDPSAAGCYALEVLAPLFPGEPWKGRG